MADLFNYKTEYPNSAGFKRPGTSKAAAEKITPRAPTLRDQVLAHLKISDSTADECAHYLGRSVLSIRPRLSELKTLGLIYDSGLTRANESGVQASVWSSYT